MRNFLLQTVVLLLSFGCVTHLYVQHFVLPLAASL